MTDRRDGTDRRPGPSGDSTERGGWGTVLAVLAGLLMQAIGAVSSGVYASAAASALGEPDRSVVFWYSGFLVFGILLTASGLALLLMVTSDLRDPVAHVPCRAIRGVMWFLAGAGGLASAAGTALAAWHLFVV